MISVRYHSEQTAVYEPLILTLALGQVVELGPVAGVHGDLASHDEAVLKQLSNVLACSKFIIKFCDWKKRHTKTPPDRGRARRSAVGKQFEWTYGSWQV